MEEKLDLKFIIGALTSKDDSNVMLVLNLLVSQNLREHFNEDQVKQLGTALLKVTAMQTEKVEEIVHRYGVGLCKVKVDKHVYSNIVGYVGRPNRLKYDRKFQKMNPYKQVDFLIRKMLYIWKDLNGIRNYGDWNQN